MIALLVAAVIVAILVEVVALRLDKSKGQTGEAENQPTQNIFSVTTVVVEPKDLRAYIELNGLIDADDTVEVYPEIGGKYANQRVQLGFKVNKGDVIADIDPSKPGSPYSLSPVRAPISGTVTSLPRRPGSTVTTETVIAKIGDIDHLQVRLQIPEREIADMRTGLAAQVSVEAYPDAVFPASVYRISPLVDSISHTKDIYLRFDRDDPRINAGMFARVKLYTRLYRQCVAIPDDSILSINDKSYVFVMDANGSATKREINTGISIDGLTLVERGLNAEERIVVQGASTLSDGAKVRDIAPAGNNDTTKGNAHE
jgi:multidrug efflux pump subunit AcrA (membrane-fusion protein)